MKKLVVIIFIALVSCVPLPTFNPEFDHEKKTEERIRTNGPNIILPLPWEIEISHYSY